MKVLVLADARSVHTERYVAELRRQRCEVLLVSLEEREPEGQSTCRNHRGFDVREEKGSDRCEECQDHKGPHPREEDSSPEGFVGQDVHGPDGREDEMEECQDHKGPDLQEEEGWTPGQVRGGREGYVRLRRWFPISTVAYALAAGEVERLIEEWRPDVISAHYASGYGFLASRIKRRGIPLTLHVWGSDVLVVPGKSWLHRRKVVRGIRAADHVFADSQYLAEATRRLARGAEVSMYPWGIERRYLALHKSEYVIGRPMRVIVPRMHEPVYDNEFLVEAVREAIERGMVRMVFPAFGSGYQRFCQRVRELGLEVREVGGGGQGQEGSGLGEGCQDHKGPDPQEEEGWTPCQARGDRNEGSANPLTQRLLRSGGDDGGDDRQNDGDEDPLGDGGGDPRKDARGSLEGVVYCYRRKSRAEFLKMMAGHDVYLSAAKSDSSPATLIEAMALGLVPVAADIPGVREWLTDESGFRYQPGDAEGLRKIVRRLAEGEGLSGEWDASCGKMRRRNRERVEREAIFEDNIASQLRVMERLRGEKRV